jgi:drug/metabolite transporter (DMT)-like permease
VGAVALGESITWQMLAGAALVAVAIGLNAIAGGQGPSEAEPAVAAAGD